LVDGLGNPVNLLFTGGNVSDCTVAVELLSPFNISESVILADKAYGTAEIRGHIESKQSSYCIPPKSNAVDPWECDFWHYKERHVVECFFQKIKQFRRIATRYDKLLDCFKGFVFLACIMLLVI
jgi:transposase